MKAIDFSKKLADKGLRVTSQRLAIIEAIYALDNHPSAEHIIEYVKENHPSISVGTVYKVLDTYVEHDILQRVKTDGDVMRFDPLLDKHHHLYCVESDQIEDYEDEELDQLIASHLKKKGIKNFEIKDFKLHITGNFK